MNFCTRPPQFLGLYIKATASGSGLLILKTLFRYDLGWGWVRATSTTTEGWFWRFQEIQNSLCLHWEHSIWGLFYCKKNVWLFHSLRESLCIFSNVHKFFFQVQWDRWGGLRLSHEKSCRAWWVESLFLTLCSSPCSLHPLLYTRHAALQLICSKVSMFPLRWGTQMSCIGHLKMFPQISNSLVELLWHVSRP